MLTLVIKKNIFFKLREDEQYKAVVKGI